MLFAHDKIVGIGVLELLPDKLTKAHPVTDFNINRIRPSRQNFTESCLLGS